jgi:microcystin-dependent protein
MSTPFMGEIKIISWNFAPQGWAFCNGQFLPINQNQALFSLFGTMYGGNGQTTFALPDLRGQVPMHVGNGHTQGEKGGQSSHTISIQELPAHIHFANVADVVSSSGAPSNARLVSQAQGANVYSPPSNLQAMAPNALGNTGGSQAHENRQPYLALNFIVALQGIFPSRN